VLTLEAFQITLNTFQVGSAQHLYVVCIYGAICLQIQKYFPPDPAIFSPKNKIFILLYIVSRFLQNVSIFHGKTARYDVSIFHGKTARYDVSIFHGKTARYDVLQIKFVDISHHRYKLRRDIK
jgi:hypothetical protein